MVKMEEVKGSSNIQSMGFDGSQSRLYIRFKNDGNRIYVYSGIPLIVWLGLKGVQSKGRYLQTQIVPYFLCQKISDADLVSGNTSSSKKYPTLLW
jgi:hypothetical protein